MAIKHVISLLSAVAGALTGAASSAILGGTYQLAVNGTFGGASVQLQMLGPDGVNYINIGTAVTVAGIQAIDLPVGATVRATITAGGTAMYATLSSVRQ